MPIGPDHDPPGWNEQRTLNPFQVLLYNVTGFIGFILGLMKANSATYVQAVLNRNAADHPNVPISPDRLAAAVVKGVVDQGDATQEALRSGLSAERFAIDVLTTGNPPGAEQLVDQWRRGLIDDRTLETGIRQGYLRSEWINFYKAFRHVPLSANSYLQGAVEGHITLDEAKRIVDGLGVTDHDAQLVYETLGSPPGVQEMIELWHRGLMTRDELVQGIKESHYKNKYIDALIAGGEYLPPPRTITTLLSHGAITNDQAHRYFVAAGLAPELADAYIASALHVKTASHKELAVGTVKSLYADRVITRDAALIDLAKVGYAGQEANLILDLADAQARQKIQNTTVSHVRTLFVSHRIDEATVQADLSKLGMDAGHVKDLLDLWTLERGTPTRQLSIGQLNQAYKKGLIDKATFVDRAVQLGYVHADALILAAIDHPPEPAP